MSQSKIDRYSLGLTLAFVALVVTTILPPGYRTAGASTLPAAADLTAEKQALNSFATSLNSLESKVASLQKKSSITSSELNSARSSASSLKTSVSQIQQTFQSVINKLKASGEWEDFDNTVLKRATDSETQTLIRNAGGAKRILQDAATQLSGLSLEIDSLVQPLNSRVASAGFSSVSRGAGFMPAGTSFAPTVTVFASLRCRFREAAWLINTTVENFQNMGCACNNNPPASFNCRGSATT